MNPWPFQKRETEEAPHATLAPAREGAGVHRTVNWLGVAHSVPPTGATFDHPWRPFLSGNKVWLRRGTVVALSGSAIIEPKIRVGGKLVPMSGEDGNSPAQLVLDPGLANEAGESWIVLEVAPAAAGELTAQSRVEIVHSDRPVSHAVSLGKQALAMILWRAGVPVRALAISYFNFRYGRVVDAVGARHFFL